MNEIINYEIEGVMTEEQKKEILEIYYYLIVFANGYSKYFKDRPNHYNDLLNIWIAKMQNWKWSQRAIAIISGAIYREINNKWNKEVHEKIKLVLEDYTKFSQYEKKRKHPDFNKRTPAVVYQGCLKSNIEELARAKNTLPDVVITKKKQPSPLQAEYISLRSQKYTDDECAEIMKKPLHEIKQMRKIIIKNAQTLVTGNPDEEIQDDSLAEGEFFVKEEIVTDTELKAEQEGGEG